MKHKDPESRRLRAEAGREENWKRWGPYLAERQWGVVREDYSADGNCWTYFPHDHARYRAYRWGEDGLLGFTDRQCRLCFALTLWNEADPILKERLFGLTNAEGNHGEDVKEIYFYLDSTPTHSYCKALYKYPQRPFPYELLLAENRRRSRLEPEFELLDTGIFDESRYFDVQVEYAKANPDDLLIVITVTNRGPEPAPIHLLPTLWFRNTWSWGASDDDGRWAKPKLQLINERLVVAQHETLGEYQLALASKLPGTWQWLFTENETNLAALYQMPNPLPYVKDAFHRYVIAGDREAVNPAQLGTKTAAWGKFHLEANASAVVRLRLTSLTAAVANPMGAEFDGIVQQRRQEAIDFYYGHMPENWELPQRQIARQAYAGLLWSKQFYYYIVTDWLQGDSRQPPPPPQRASLRNGDWSHLFNRDVLLMPDKWEYPWYAAWDSAFHAVAVAAIDPDLAKEQLLLMLREWYMHPNGQLPAYEFSFSDVNPPVHAWACWRVYKMTGARGERDRQFLERTFHKLLLNFTWWVNRKDITGRNLFSGGFLGMDNISLFDRSHPLPNGGHLEQADGTAWMAFFCLTMLAIALELALANDAYEDVASKFFEHFVAIADALNHLGGTGLWDEADGFYYDRMHIDSTTVSLRVRSLVGLLPLIAVEVLEDATIDHLPGFRKRMQWFLEHRPDLARTITYLEPSRANGCIGRRLLAVPTRERLLRVLRRMLAETEFLSPFGIRSLSAAHRDAPFCIQCSGEQLQVRYVPGDSDSPMFGGNSNWRGPIWMPMNYLLIEALERYHHFYGDSFQVECPTGSGVYLSLRDVANVICRRLESLFLHNSAGYRPCLGEVNLFATDPHWQPYLLFHEYFDGDTGRGLGANHQTGWTALITRLLGDRSVQHLHSGIFSKRQC